MKKNALFALALAALATTVGAAPVERDATRTAAANFWNSYRPTDVKPASAHEFSLASHDGLFHLDIYTLGDQGFVIMANDDCVTPVLAYSFDSPFPEELHPSLRHWLGGYEAQIAEAVESGAVADKGTAAAWNNLLTSTVPDSPKSLLNVPAMLTTKWNQSDPYNRHCPFDSVERARAVVGCVATAMAQVMKYWNHPSCGTGSHSFMAGTDYASYSYGTLTADFANTTYLWGYMPNALALSSNENQINAVAQLSYHCGVAVEMMYSPEASGAYTISYGDNNRPCSERALRDYFRYSPDLHGEQRWQYNDATWTSMIDADIEAGRPILYTGSDNSGGHAFVLDGSDTNSRYHFNWGWGSYGDGYYVINNLNPGGNGVGGNSTYTFNSGQTAIFGIEPVPQQFDTVDFYDTICATDAYYHFYEYTLPGEAADYSLVHLNTVYNVHVSVVDRRYAYFDPNGGEGTTRNNRYCPNVGAVMPANSFSREGYTFIGWCLDPTGNGTIYQPGDTVNIKTNKFFYAIWSNDNGTNAIDTPANGDLVVWPNPTTSHISLSLDNGTDITYTVIDSHGRVLTSKKAVGGKAKISLRDLPAGTYTLLVHTADTFYKQRIIKL